MAHFSQLCLQTSTSLSIHDPGHPISSCPIKVLNLGFYEKHYAHGMITEKRKHYKELEYGHE